ncbi:MAG: TetR/AcrR family transcriptional regulator [Clostridium sp.]|nr:TetR/AcrR family transcriptional regulator [Clostridium sp.]
MNNEELREYNKKLVLEKTIECIKELGIDGCKVSDVARRSNLTVKSIERYFGTRNNLIVCAIDDFLTKAYEKSKCTIDTTDWECCNGLNHVKNILERQKFCYNKQPEFVAFPIDMELFFYQNNIDENLSQLHRINRKIIISLLEKAIKIGIEDGSIKFDIDVSITSKVIASSYSGLVQRLEINDRKHYSLEYINDLIDNYIDMILNSLKNH